MINSIEDIQRLVREGFTDWKDLGEVRVTYHEDLVMFSYTDAVQHAGRWNAFEQLSRGLILRLDGKIVARPYEKFFNWGEGDRSTSAPLAYVQEKMDGSLGILYVNDGQVNIATRGSFISEQARWANAYLRKNFNTALFPSYYTFLLEIVYPENQIVVDYGEMAGLVLLDIRTNKTGRYLEPSEVDSAAEWLGFTRPKRYEFPHVIDILNCLDRLPVNEEGFVAVFEDGSRFKFKGQAYTEMHRLISYMTVKNIVKHLQACDLEFYLDKLPVKYRAECGIIVNEVIQKVEETHEKAISVFVGLSQYAHDRKLFAERARAVAPDMQHYLFFLLDGRPIRDLLYKDLLQGRI